jgi:hypothetical protein
LPMLSSNSSVRSNNAWACHRLPEQSQVTSARRRARSHHTGKPSSASIRAEKPGASPSHPGFFPQPGPSLTRSSAGKGFDYGRVLSEANHKDTARAAPSQSERWAVPSGQKDSTARPVPSEPDVVNVNGINDDAASRWTEPIGGGIKIGHPLAVDDGHTAR